jgi:hypothetical protein
MARREQFASGNSKNNVPAASLFLRTESGEPTDS